MRGEKIGESEIGLGLGDDFSEGVGVAEHAESAGDVAELDRADAGLDFTKRGQRDTDQAGEMFLRKVAAQPLGTDTAAEFLHGLGVATDRKHNLH